MTSSNLSDCACTSLRKASRAVTRLYEEAMVPSGLTITQFALLRRLRRDGPTPLSRLAERLGTERTALYRMIAPLETRGLVAIAAAGPRTRVAALTAAGAALLDESGAAWGDVQSRFLDRLGAGRWAALQTLLAEAARAAEEASS